MNIVISKSSQTPMYLQIYNQIAGQIAGGELKKGEALPPIRTVAKELRISVITVKRAWEELERDGFIKTVPGSGCYVQAAQGTRGDRLKERISADIEYYRAAGLDKETLLELIDKYWYGR